MYQRIPPDVARAFRETLRREAAQTQPAFSEALHERILASIEPLRKDASGLSRPARPAASRWRRLSAVVAAAACLLAAAWLGWEPGWLGFGDRDVVATKDIWQERVDLQQADGAQRVGSASAVLGEDPATDFEELPSDHPLSMFTALTTVAGLPSVDPLASGAEEGLSQWIDSASVVPPSPALKHDTRLAAESLLLRLPLGVELMAGL
jgi:hypothetical protein